MPAKPIVDIMCGVSSLEASHAAIDILTAHNYCYYPYKADTMHWFCKPSPNKRTHHLHLVPFKSTLWHERLAFRDYLRKNHAAAEQYALLKKDLAKQYPDNRERYTEGKWRFIKDILGTVKWDRSICN